MLTLKSYLTSRKETFAVHLYLKYFESSLRYAFWSLYLAPWKIIYISPLGSLGKLGCSFSLDVAILRINLVGSYVVINFKLYYITQIYTKYLIRTPVHNLTEI